MANNNDQNSYVNGNPDITGTELEDSGLNEVSNPDVSMTRAGGSAIGNFARGFKDGLTAGLNDNPNSNIARGVRKQSANGMPSSDGKKNNESNNRKAKKNDGLDNERSNKESLSKKSDGINPATGLSKPNNNSGRDDGGLGNTKRSNGNSINSDNSPLSRIGNRLSNSGIANKARGVLSKVGLGGKEGLPDKDEKDGKNSGETGGQEKSGSSLQGLSAPVIQIGRFKISMPVLSTIVIIAGIMLAILLFVALLTSFDDDEDDLCGDGSSTYSGSQSELEFLCKMQSPFGNDNNHIVTCKAGDNVYHTTHTHQGIDIGCSTGDPIYAVQDATVVKTSYDGGRGYYVFLDHGDGFGTVYQHLSQASNVSDGQKVTKGQQIGTCGSTGQSSGPHLHFEINTNPSNPWNHYLTIQNDYFGPENSNIGPNIESFMKNCGSILSSSGNNFFIGDSRINFMMEQGILNESYTVAKNSQAYDWFVDTAIDEANEKMGNDKKYNIIIWLGVNEFRKNTPQKYYNKYVELAQGQWSKHTIYVVSVGTIKEHTYKENEGVTPAKIDQFNAKMRRLISDGGVSNIKYIELDFKEEPDSADHDHDGVHYSDEQNIKIYNEIVSKVSSGGSTSSNSSSSEQSSSDVKTYDEIEILDTISKSTGESKNVSPPSGYVFQSFAYNNGLYYLQAIQAGASGMDGFVYKYDSNLSLQNSSPKSQIVGHGNGLAYSTADNKLYSVTKADVRDNKKTMVIDPGTLEVEGSKDLNNGTSSIAYDRLTNRFITSSGPKTGDAGDAGHLYVYDSNLSNKVGAKEITKKRWATPGDIAAYGGIIYVTIYGSNNYIDMYNEDTGDYLGSYNAPGSEIEGIDIDDSGEIVLLFHNSDIIQFTGIKAKVISGSASTSSGDQCCVTTSLSSSSGGNYCPNGITVTGTDAGTYELDDYIERVVTAENGGAHPEALKALAIAARTYAINRTNNCSDSIPNSTAAQVMAHEASDKVKEALQSVKGSVLLYNGNYFSAEYSSFWGDCAGGQCTSTFIRIPSDVTRTYSIPSNYVTISKGHERGLSQNGSNFMATEEGKTYDEILRFFYADGIEITGASGSGNSCSLGGNGTYKEGKIWDYNQFDYKDAYCGGTIADSGCGPTAMAMVVSTLLKAEHNPSEVAKASNVCSTDSHQFFTEAATKYNLKAVTTKDHEEVLTALNRGDSLVIANVTNQTVDGKDNFWTSDGHYIVLGGHSGREVWVQDPHKGSDGRTNSQGDGVYDFDKYIVPAATNGYIIITKN